MHCFRISAVALSFSCFVSIAAAQPSSLIKSPIDDSDRIALAGNVRPEAMMPKYDQGAVSDSLAINDVQLLLKLSPQQAVALDKFVDDQKEPNSPNYHRWLTAAEFGERFGASDSDIAAVTAWLGSHGFRVNGVSAGRNLIDFSGDAGKIRSAFHTEIHNLNINGIHHLSNVSEPQIPIALSPAVAGIVSLNDFRPHPMLKHAKYTTASGCPKQCYAIVPADLAKIYNLTPLFNASTAGQGETIVVIEDTDVYDKSNWTRFRNKFGLSTFTTGRFQEVHPSGGISCSDPGANEDDGEAILDAEWASAAAPGATIELASCTNGPVGFGGFAALTNIINSKKLPPVISISYGDCEPDNGAAGNAAIKAMYEQADSEGISVFVSSGDENASECDPEEAYASHGIATSGWASTTHNVAVGGTDFADTFAGTNSTYWNSSNAATYGSAKSYIPEIPWNDSCASEKLAIFYTGSDKTYSSNGFCNNKTGEQFLGTDGGGGAPSNCAVGKPASSGVANGSCAGYKKPSWQQKLVGVPADGVRDVPDVSLFAADGIWSHFYLYCDTDPSDQGGSCSGAPINWPGGGGTSFSSPIMAGIQALVDQKNGPQGDPDNVYYKLAATEYGAKGNADCNSSKGKSAGSSCVFYDVTTGDNDVNCRGSNNCYDPKGDNGVLSTSNTAYQLAYKAGVGWDFGSGIGTVNANNLVKNWP